VRAGDTMGFWVNWKLAVTVPASGAGGRALLRLFFRWEIMGFCGIPCDHILLQY
jgi:hypothetical protein